ncbi:MAG TPA: cytochrome c biogenesis protein CcsA [Thermoanaerobaculia bacterium]|nr:cytochrome c biogenesis protein CcsA [Thermoanaerobaculia bacterium]
MEWHLLGWLAVLCYLGAEALAIVSMREPRPSTAWPGALLLAAGLALQFADLRLEARALGSVPYRTLGGSVSLFGWMLAIAYLALQIRHREKALGPFLIPIVIGSSAIGLLLPFRASAPTPETRGTLFALHVTLAILAYAAFTFSFILSLLYLIQNRQIRRKQTGVLFARLPALEVIGQMNRTSVSVGLVVLTVALLFGGAWALHVWGTLTDPKIVWAVLTLLVYAFLLWMDRRGWEGPRVALLSILGFGVVLFSYTVVNLYFSRTHTFR